MVVSPDGKNVYAATRESDAVARFNRNSDHRRDHPTAASSGCISESGAGAVQRR